MKKIKGGVTAAKGFKAASAQAGIKYKNRSDMALVVSDVPAVSAGTFTTNVVKAAPVRWDMKLIKENETVQAIVLNSGIANACTGKLGDENNEKMAELIADATKLSKSSILTASTGVIGKQLVMDAVARGAVQLAKNLSESLEAGTMAAKAIMTTDTFDKECAVEVDIDGVNVTIGGMCKGSGMIHPNMATMLGVVTTDAKIAKKALQKAVSDAVKVTFNMISVDRDTSTNDSLIAMANGLAENTEILEDSTAYTVFYDALLMVLRTLSKMMAADGEGATKLFECTIVGANDKAQAEVLAKSVITSSLVKTAVFGNDANWGRILCAMGYAGEVFDPEQVDLYITGKEEFSFYETDSEVILKDCLKLVEDGMATDYSEEEATKILSLKKVTAIADLKMGTASATAWGCDLTYDYVKINADYRS